MDQPSTVKQPALDRPPTKRELNRAKLLRTGTELLSRQSYTATGVDHVIKEAGLTKGTFYHYFKSKELFALEVVQQYAGYFNDKLDTYLLNETDPPLERLAAYVHDSIKTLKRHDFVRACVVGNLSQELGASDSVLVKALQETFLGWERRVAACLDEARARGDISDTADVQALATLFWMGWEGALMQARLFKRPDPIRVFFDGYIKMVQ